MKKTLASGKIKIADMKKGEVYLLDASGDMYCSGYEVVRGDGTMTWLNYWEEDGQIRYREVPSDTQPLLAIEMKDKAFELEQAKEIVGDVPFEDLDLDDAYVTMMETYMEIGAKEPNVPAGYEDFGRYIEVEGKV